jgi:hypothetical protein
MSLSRGGSRRWVARARAVVNPRWHGADLDQLVDEERRTARPMRAEHFRAQVPARADQGADARLALRLATNAVKYGAPSSASGRLSVDWNSQADALTIHWQESAGPEAQAEVTGFEPDHHWKHRRQLGGQVRFEWLARVRALTVPRGASRSAGRGESEARPANARSVRSRRASRSRGRPWSRSCWRISSPTWASRSSARKRVAARKRRHRERARRSHSRRQSVGRLVYRSRPARRQGRAVHLRHRLPHESIERRFAQPDPEKPVEREVLEALLGRSGHDAPLRSVATAERLPISAGGVVCGRADNVAIEAAAAQASTSSVARRRCRADRRLNSNVLRRSISRSVGR